MEKKDIGILHRMKKQMYLLKLLATLTAILALLVVMMYYACQYGCTTLIFLLQVVIPLLCILLAGVFVSLPGKIVKDKMLLLIMFVLLVAFGIWVYSDATELKSAHWSHRLLFPVNSTLATLFPSRGDYDIFDGSNPNYRHITMFLLFHTLAYFYFAWLGFSLFGRKLLSRLSIKFIPRENKNLIWGYSDGAFELAKDMINSTDDAEPIFILDDEIEFDSENENMIFDKLSNEGIIAFSTRYDNLSTRPEDFQTSLFSRRQWTRLFTVGKCFTGYRHYFITENQDFNVKMALKVLTQLSLNVKNLTGKVHIFVRTEQDDIDSFFQSKFNADKEGELRKFVEVHIFNQSDITARQFVKDYPVLSLRNVYNTTTGRRWLDIDYDTLTVNGEVKILLLGLGWTGFELLRKLVCDAQYLDSGKLNIVVVDENYEDQHGRYQYIVEEAGKFGVNITINPQGIDKVNSRLFYEWLGLDDPMDGVKNILSFSRIIVAIGNDELNVNTALQLTNFRYHYLSAREAIDASLMPEPIFAHVRDKEKYEYYDDPQRPVIRIFGGLKTIYNVSNLVDEKMDDIAKLVNHVYCNSGEDFFTEDEILTDNKKVESNWTECSIFNQNSSRAVAMNIRNVLTLTGGDPQDFASKVNKHLERLGELEHKRWNAFHYMHGIGTWRMEEVQPIQFPQDTKPKARGKLMFNNSLVRHICLVHNDELDAATQRVQALGNTQENYKKTDQRIVRHFPIFHKFM